MIIAVVVAGRVWPDDDSSSAPPTATSPSSASSPRTSPPAGQAPFVTSVSSDGRSFRDQHGDPILVRGDSPWSLLTDLSAEEAESYFADREERGVNAVIVSLLGSVANGGPSDDGATADGVAPFVEGGGLTEWNDEYWQRARAAVRSAEEHGITVLLYPVDSWTVDSSLVPRDVEECTSYGRKVAEHFAGAPNILWMAGGDYLPERPTGTDIDRCVEGMLAGIRATGDGRPFAMQLGSAEPMTTTDQPFWRDRVDWNFVYTYGPTYESVERAYRRDPPIPTIFGEGNYERENNTGDEETTNQTLRRQTAWALTSGAAGDFYGSDDWQFLPDWRTRLESPGLADVGHVRDVVAGLPWWQLVPDHTGDFLTDGRGEPVTRENRTQDVLANDYATAAVAPDGVAALVYVPTSRTVTIDTDRLADGVQATWVDPSSGRERPTDVRRGYRTPGENADGDDDWLLVFATPGE